MRRPHYFTVADLLDVLTNVPRHCMVMITDGNNPEFSYFVVAADYVKDDVELTEGVLFDLDWAEATQTPLDRQELDDDRL